MSSLSRKAKAFRLLYACIQLYVWSSSLPSSSRLTINCAIIKVNYAHHGNEITRKNLTASDIRTCRAIHSKAYSVFVYSTIVSPTQRLASLYSYAVVIMMVDAIMAEFT
uniref:Uncharacterized protein n=1 Tax=Glossina palpalis gambiensis TaxID=67801 RepID=A0A1B0ASH8_9MUSC